MAKVLPGYAPREPQICMAEEIDRAIGAGQHLFVEAPTGVGKSYAALVPAIRHALIAKKKILVVTATIGLQEQLVEKDLPALRAALPWPFTFRLVKGRGNYACHYQVKEGEAARVGALYPTEKVEDRPWFDTLWEWFENTETGDKSELEALPPGPIWAAFTVGHDECLGTSCAYKSKCFYDKARTSLAETDVLVVNYHLLFAHLAVLKSTGGAIEVLPQRDVVIADECFPAGTSVCGRPIEMLRVGDFVDTYDESTGSMRQGRVTALFSSVPSMLVRAFIGQRSVVCTPGHPFLTRSGWKVAAQLTAHDDVLSVVDNGHDETVRHVRRDALQRLLPEQEGGVLLRRLSGSQVRFQVADRSLLRVWGRTCALAVPRSHPYEVLRFVSFGPLDCSEKEDLRFVHLVRGSRGGYRTPSAGAGVEGARVLLGSVSGPVSTAAQLSAHDAAQPDENTGSSCQVESDFTARGAQASCTWRQRLPPAGAPEASVRSSGLAHGGGGAHACAQEFWHAQPLQVGRGVEDAHGGRGGGRGEPWRTTVEGEGLTEGRVPAWVRVDRVEVLEPGSDGRFGGLCPDGHVYNLEVEDTHTYVANGFVVHNCHRAGDVCRDFLGRQVTYGRLNHLIKALRKASGPDDKVTSGVVKNAKSVFDLFFQELEQLRKSAAYDVFFRDPWFTLSSEGVHDALGSMAAAFTAKKSSDNEMRTAVMDRCVELCRQVDADLRDLMSLDTEGVVFLEEHGHRMAIREQPIDLGPVLRTWLFDRYTVIGMSATLSADGETFGYVLKDLGAPPGTKEFLADPIFTDDQALLVIPEDIVDPTPQNAVAFQAAVAQIILQVSTLIDGGILCLFTSHRNLQAVLVICRTALQAQGRTVLAQGDAPPIRLLEQFKSDIRSVLFGAETFWEGVDVPGRSLEAVIIDKLPFQVVDDPVSKAREAKGEKVFFTQSVPRAVLRFKQGFGRLIRTPSDRGVVFLLDKRVRTKGYGAQFLDSLPPTRLARAGEPWAEKVVRHMKETKK